MFQFKTRAHKYGLNFIHSEQIVACTEFNGPGPLRFFRVALRFEISIHYVFCVASRDSWFFCFIKMYLNMFKKIAAQNYVSIENVNVIRVNGFQLKTRSWPILFKIITYRHQNVIKKPLKTHKIFDLICSFFRRLIINILWFVRDLLEKISWYVKIKIDRVRENASTADFMNWNFSITWLSKKTLRYLMLMIHH